MENITNQAVVFTKPIHHLNLDLSPEQLDAETSAFLEASGFAIASSHTVTGHELAERGTIRQHYLMYSKASYGDVEATDAGKAKFTEAFGRNWDEEVASGRIAGNPQLMERKGVDADELFEYWNARFTTKQTVKIQPGVIVAWIDELGCFCMNAFYPALEANFHHPETRIAYHVVEFNPELVSWARFRKHILGSTDASKADPASFRGRLYARCRVAYPGRDNFVHGSAGPFEGFVERAIHEPDFDMPSNPVGQYLAARGVTLDSFAAWKARQSIAELGALFDAAEEKDTAEVLRMLDDVEF